MSIVSPNKIYDDFKHGKLTKSQASDLLMSLVESSIERDIESKIVVIKLLALIGANDGKVFKFLEHLLISDINDFVRGNAGFIIIGIFRKKSFEVIKWVLKHEKSEQCLTQIILALEKTREPKLHSLLEIIEYVHFEENIFFPFESLPIIYLNNKKIVKISDIKRLEKFSNLKKLYLDFNQIAEIEGLDNLSNLKSLHLKGNRIKEIKGLERLSKLEYLYLNNNEIKEIKGLNNLSKLKSLMILDNKISNIQGLEDLTNLEILNLRNNKIAEINGLNALKNLKRVDLSNNYIFKIKGLGSLNKLEFLDLSYNKITEFKGLENLKSLKFLDLRNNEINEIRGLSSLKKLKHLYIGFNKPLNIENLKEMDHLKILDILSVGGNNIPNSSFDFFSENGLSNNPDISHSSELRNVKYVPTLFKSKSNLKKLKFADN
jgi:Leucine-rich repeat (LRR) protein